MNIVQPSFAPVTIPAKAGRALQAAATDPPGDVTQARLAFIARLGVSPTLAPTISALAFGFGGAHS
jgi:hypothetical protein